MKISFFCIATEPFKNQYPIKYSIKSILPIADEIVLVCGRKEEKSEEYFRELSDKIKIFNTNLWEEDWKYSDMTYHFDYALRQCTGDICIKFDIDFLFNSRDQEEYKSLFIGHENDHLIYLPRLNYLDLNHARFFEKGLYAVNKKLLNDENKKFWIGVKDYVNTLMIEGDYQIGTMDYHNKASWVFNFDCTFMDIETYKEKHYRWHKAYFKEFNNLNTFNLTLEQVEDKDFLLNFVINKSLNKIKYAIKKKFIWNNIEYPKLIVNELRNLNEKHYGHSYFGNINFEDEFYELRKEEFNLENYQKRFPKMTEDELKLHYHIFGHNKVNCSKF